MPGARIISIIVCVVLCIVTRSVSAEIMGADALELRVAEADVIVVGRAMADVEPAAQDFPRVAIPIEISDIIKGENVPRRIVVDLPRHGEVWRMAVGWKKGDRVLALLLRREHVPPDQLPADGDEALREFYAMPPEGNWPPSVMRLDFEDFQVVTMDLNVVKGMGAIIDAMRAAAAVPTPQPLREHVFDLREDSPVFKALYRGSGTFLVVPVDIRLEELGRQWARQGKDALALEALKYFPSPANARVLQDIMRRDSINTVVAGGRLSVLTLPARQRAYELLQKWGEHPARPPIRLPDDLYHPLRWFHAAVAMALGVIAAAALVALRRWRRLSRRAISRVALSTLAMAVGALWMLSLWRVGEVHWDGAGDQVWVSCYRGRMQLAWIDDWPGTRSVVVPDTQSVQSMISQLQVAGPVIPPRGLMAGWIPLYPNLRAMIWDVPSSAPPPWWESIGMRHMQQLQYYGESPGRSLPRRAYPTTSSVAAPYLNVQRWELHIAWLIAILSAWPAYATLSRLRHFSRKNRRLRQGLCINCGYDLRASPERCPECGMEVSHAGE